MLRPTLPTRRADTVGNNREYLRDVPARTNKAPLVWFRCQEFLAKTYQYFGLGSSWSTHRVSYTR